MFRSFRQKPLKLYIGWRFGTDNHCWPRHNRTFRDLFFAGQMGLWTESILKFQRPKVSSAEVLAVSKIFAGPKAARARLKMHYYSPHTTNLETPGLIYDECSLKRATIEACEVCDSGRYFLGENEWMQDSETLAHPVVHCMLFD